MSLRSKNKTVAGIEKIIKHEDYNNPYVFNNDIAIVKLAVPMISNTIRTAALPTNNTEVGTVMKSPGFGYKGMHGQGGTTKFLLKTEMRVLNVTLCQEDKNWDGKRYGERVNEERNICAQGLNHSGTCRGDSGGSLIDSDNIVRGIVSWGTGEYCDDEGEKSVYTNVFYYLSWIKLYVPLQ